MTRSGAAGRAERVAKALAMSIASLTIKAVSSAPWTGAAKAAPSGAAERALAREEPIDPADGTAARPAASRPAASPLGRRWRGLLLRWSARRRDRRRQRRAASQHQPRGWSLWDPFGFSNIAARIVVLNVVALGVLVGGVLYLSQFRAGLIDQKITSMTTQAELVAVTIAEAAGETFATGESGTGYDRIMANEVLRRLSLPAGLRAQIYNTKGHLTGDTRILFSHQSVIEISRIPAEGFDHGALARIEDLYNRFVALWAPSLPLYRETAPAGISSDKEVFAALRGDTASALRVNSENELIISVATPVKRVKTVMGALVLSTQGGDIDKIVQEERVAILQVFLVAFAVLILSSMALAQTVAWPLRQLANAAEGARRHSEPLNPERIDIPDFSNRRDEIGHLSVALRRMTEALYSRIDAIETFAADVSHEIKNPLTSLRSAVETLRGARTEQQREALLAVIEHDVRRLDRLVTDISNASRLDTELVRDRRERFDLARLLNLVVEGAVCQAEAEGVALVRRGLDEPLEMRGLEARLAQVFYNLIDNARSFSRPGSVIMVSAEETTMDHQPALLIEVLDEGPGVPPENLESVFERFYSARPDGEEFGRHSGLGLSICRQIVEAHGGKIWAENRVDRTGALFCVLLPR